MTTENFSRLAAAIFTLIAILQLSRALIGVQVMAGQMMVPLWPSWLAFIVFGVLALVGFRAKKS